jgi:MFS transporter, SP family, arabinose:H+ symporter
MTATTSISDTRAKSSAVVLVSVITAVGGFLFGFDNGSISGSVGWLQDRFGLGPAGTGWITSCLTVGCIVGVVFAGRLSDRVGRKRVLVVVAAVFIVGAIGESVAPNTVLLVIARILVGIGIGLETTVAPLYISEIAPARIRGRLVSFNQLFNCIANLVIFAVSAVITASFAEQWNVDYGWRLVFIIGIIPAVLLLSLLRFIPESPRWLVQQGRMDDAQRSLERLTASESDASASLESIRAALEVEQKPRIGELWEPKYRRTLVITMTVALFQQFTGITAVFYYAPEIFKSAGFGSNSSIQSTVLVGGALVLGTVLSAWIIDRVGRRTLLIWGSVIMAVLLGGISLLFTSTHPNGPLLIALLLAYVIAWGCSFGTVSYVLPGEMYPTRVRGLGSSASVLSQWVCTFLVSEFFPILVAALGSAITFGIIAVMSVLALVFSAAFVPETKQRTLDELELQYANR